MVASVGGELVLAEVADSYAIRLSNGDEVESPSRAAVRVNELATGKHHSINGWTYWLVGEAGPLLVDVRVQYLICMPSELRELTQDLSYGVLGRVLQLLLRPSGLCGSVRGSVESV